MEHIERLKAEYYAELEVLSNMDIGTEAYRIAVDGIRKLADVITEAEKAELDRADRAAEKEAAEQHKQIDFWLKVATIAVPVITATMSLCYGVWAAKTSLNIEFGKNEIQTSTVGKKILGSAINPRF